MRKSHKLTGTQYREWIHGKQDGKRKEIEDHLRSMYPEYSVVLVRAPTGRILGTLRNYDGAGVPTEPEQVERWVPFALPGKRDEAEGLTPDRLEKLHEQIEAVDFSAPESNGQSKRPRLVRNLVTNEVLREVTPIELEAEKRFEPDGEHPFFTFQVDERFYYIEPE